MARLPETENFPWDEDKVRSRDPDERVDYFKSLIKRLRDVYSKIANAVNQNIPGGGEHNILSATHPDTVVGSGVAGDILYANAIPAWTKLAKGTDGQFLKLASGLPSWASGGGLSGTEVINLVYPVGSIYVSVVATNPGTLFGVGTWVAFGSGRVLVGLDAGQTEFDTVQEVGGAKTINIAHTHTGPNHVHSLNQGLYGAAALDAVIGTETGAGGTGATGAMSQNATPSVLQPYIVVYMFKRVS